MASTYGARHGLPGYDTFKTGLDFATVQKMLWVESEDSADWKQKSRGCVLFLWHKLKLEMYEQMIDRSGGRVPVRKQITHRGHQFWVTYWVKVSEAKPAPFGKVPVQKQIINRGRPMTVTYWKKPERIAA
jgi:hypothetical protein